MHDPTATLPLLRPLPSRLALFGLCIGLVLSLLPASAYAQNPGEPGPAPVPAPDRVLWLRADQGVTGTSEVTEWLDQSSSGNDAGLTSLAGPEFVSSLAGMNNQPALLFDRANSEGMNVADTDDINGDDNGTIQYATRTITLAFQTGSDVNTRQIIYEEGGGSNGFNVYIESGSVVASAWSETQGWAQHFSISETVTTNEAYITTFVFDKDAPNQLEFFVNGTSAGTVSDPSITFMNEHVGDIGIGNVIEATQFPPNDEVATGDDGTEGFSGHIGEVVLTSGALNTAQRQILESDLSERYAITIAGDRYGFPNTLGAIRGIGEAADGTRQTEATSGILSFEVPAFDGTGDDFALVGHNENAETFITDTDPTDIGQRLDRVWRYDVVGSPSFDLAFDVSGFPTLASGQTYELLIENDETFTGSATAVGGTLSGTTFTVSSASLSSLSDGDYLTLAKTATTGPSSLTYAPNPLADLQSNLPFTATASVGGASGTVTYAISPGSDDTNGSTTVTYGTTTDGTPQDVEINTSTGEITVNSGAPTGEYTATVDATDSNGTVTFTDVLTITVQEQVTLSYDTPSQAVPPSTAIQTVAPTASSIPDGSVSYSLVVDELTAGGLAFNASTGEISGTPTQNGLIRAVVEATGSGAAAGTATAEVNIAVVDGDGPAGIGDDVSTILNLDASDLSATDGNSLSTWTDASNYGNDASSGSATYRASQTGLNDRPALDFDGGSSFAIPDNAQFNNGGEPYVQRTLAVAFRTGDDLSVTTPEGIYAEGGGTRGLSVYVRNGDLYVGMWNEADSNEDDETTPWGPHFFSAETNTSDGGTGTVSIDTETAYVVTLTYNYAENVIEAYVNGTLIGTETGPSDGTGAGVGRFFDHNQVAIGGEGEGTLESDGGDEEYSTFTGEIGEVVAYGVALTDAQRQILESSLGAKYGIGVTNSRFDFAGTEEFDAGLEVVGTGQLGDNPVAHDPAVTSGRLTVTPSALLADGDFTVIGHDDSSAVFSREPNVGDFAGTGGDPEDDVADRLARTWRVDITNAAAYDYGDLSFDVSSFTLGTNQTYVLLAENNSNFTASATVVEGTDAGGTFTPDGAVNGTLTSLSDASYITLARTLGPASAPTSLSYSPNPLRAQDGTTPQTSTPTVVGAQPVPTFSIASGGATGISVDTNTGVLTVDPSAAAQGTYTVTIEADNGVGSGGPVSTDVDVEVFTPLTNLAYPDGVQTVSDGEDVSTITPNFTPALASITDGDVAYTLQRVNAFGTIQSDLSGTGLSLAANGNITGTPSQLGTVSVVIEAAGSGGAGGTVTADVKVTAVGNTGIAGIGDATTTLLQLTSDDLAGLPDSTFVADWADASAYGNNASQTASGEQPTLQSDASAALNGEPVLRFDGTDDELEIDNAASLNTGGEPYLQRAKTIVFRTGGSLSGRQVLYEEGGGTRGYNLYIDGGDLHVAGWNNANDALTDDGNDNLPTDEDPTTPWEDDIAGSDGFVFVQTPVTANTAYVVTLFHDYADGTIEMWLNGDSIGSAPGAGRQYNHGGEIRIGQDESSYDQNGRTSAGDPFGGDVAALSFNDASLNDFQRQLLHNALAAQYGITPAANDLYAGDETANGDFDFGVLGVGQIDAANRHTSASVGGLTIANTGTLADGDYLVLGSEQKAGSITTSDIGSSFGLEERLERIWYADATGSGATVDVTFDLLDLGLSVDLSGATASDFRLITRGTGNTGSWSDTGESATINGDAITFSGVSISSDAVYTLGTVNAADSPLTTNTILITGSSGNEGDANTGVLGGDAGWRLIGPLVDGIRADAVESDPDDQLIEFNLPTNQNQPNMFFFWDDDVTQTGPDGAFEAAAPDDLLYNGIGTFLFLFDDTGTSDADPIDPTLPITFPGTPTGSGDVTVGDGQAVDGSAAARDDALSVDAEFHLLANPYVQPYDLTGLDATQSGGFQATVEIWDPAAGSYVTATADGSTSGATAAPAGDRIAPGQAFWLQRSSVGSGPTQVTFSDAGIVSSDDRTIIGSNAAADSTLRARVGLRTEAFTSAGASIGQDLATSFYFARDVATGWDRYDASKFTPLTSRYVTLAPVGVGPEGAAIPKAQESLPLTLEDSTDIPLALTVEGPEAASLIIETERWDDIPTEWDLALVDTRGTATTSDDAVFPLDASSRHRIPLTDAAAQAMADSSTIATAGALPPASPTLPESPVMALPSVPSPSSESDAPAHRFALRILPNANPLPVELAAFDAVRDGDRVQLRWQTASETNNAGFYIERQALALGDSTAAPSAEAWQAVGFVEGYGTTTAPQDYRFRVEEDLGYGRHLFRLRQVDTDGTETAIAPVEVTLQLTEAYAVDAPYPNPVRQQATLPITVRETQQVAVEVYDILGRRVAVPFTQDMPGQRTEQVRVSTGRLSSGVYFLRIRGEQFVTTRRITVVR